MNKYITAMFIGHRECYGINRKEISDEIQKLIRNGINIFLSGGLGEFDRICAAVVYELKKEYPEVRSYLVIPYIDFNVFEPYYFDGTVFPEELENVPYRVRIPARNKYMVDNSCYAICYVNNGWGGSGKTYAYAKKQKLSIMNFGRLD